MAINLTNEIIRSLSSTQSFERGRDLYKNEAIFDAARQGDLLLGKCEGNSEPFYILQVEIDAGGVRSAECSCPYDWGGICKHLVALLLTFIHKPAEFTERKDIPELLQNLDREALVGLLSRLVENNPELYDELETAAMSARRDAKTQGAVAQPKRKTQVSEQEYRRQVKGILGGLRGRRSSEAYWMMSAMIQELRQVRATAYRFLEAGDAQGALVILLALLEEVADSYEYFDDSDGDLSDFLGEVGQDLAETILSQDFTGGERKTLEKRLLPVIDELVDYGIDDIQIAMLALEEGWSALSLEDEDDDENWYDDLTQVKLNVLERQGRVEEFLDLCRAAGKHLRYAMKLLELGRKDEAMLVAMNWLETADDALAIARSLRDLGHVQDAIAVAEHGLLLEGSKSTLGNWLGPLEEAQGRTKDALLAYRMAFNSQPSLELYQTLQRLAGPEWWVLKPELISALSGSYSSNVLADVYLYEQEWDSAIRLADAQAADYRLLEKVAEVVVPYQPEWVIRVSLGQSDHLIAKTQSKYYTVAGAWLGRAKRAYIQMGRQSEWQAYLTALKLQYSRRPALQEVLRRL
jgi:uncharacterized Zn finger protein